MLTCAAPALPMRTSSGCALFQVLLVPAGNRPYSRREPSAATTSTQLASFSVRLTLCPPGTAATGAGTVVAGSGRVAVRLPLSSPGNGVFVASSGWSSAGAVVAALRAGVPVVVLASRLAP